MRKCNLFVSEELLHSRLGWAESISVVKFSALRKLCSFVQTFLRLSGFFKRHEKHYKHKMSIVFLIYPLEAAQKMMVKESYVKNLNMMNQ